MALHTGDDGVSFLLWCGQQGCLTLISRLTFHRSLSLRMVLSSGLSAHIGPERLQNVARHVQARLNAEPAGSRRGVPVVRIIRI